MRQRLMTTDPPTRPDSIPRGMPPEHLLPVNRGIINSGSAFSPTESWQLQRLRAEEGGFAREGRRRYCLHLTTPVPIPCAPTWALYNPLIARQKAGGAFAEGWTIDA